MLLLGLCAALLCSAAFADTAEMADMANTDSNDIIYGHCTMPDGRVIFSGCLEALDVMQPSVPRLLCLNPDRSVCWEYREQDSNIVGYGPVYAVDGNTIAVSFTGQNSSGVKFFTPDCQPARSPLSFPNVEGEYYSLDAFGLLKKTYTEALEEKSEEYIGWDGNLLFRWDGPAPIWDGYTLAEADGLVMSGRSNDDPEHNNAKLMKVDYSGNTVWETTLPFLSEQTDSSVLGNCVKTADGGYLALLMEYDDDAEEDGLFRTYALVRFDAAGRLLWTNRDSFAEREREYYFWTVAEYNGKGLVCYSQEDPETGLAYMRYLWFDGNGQELGLTENRFAKEELPRFSGFDRISVSDDGMVLMEDGLWHEIAIWGNSEDGAGTMENGQDNFLVRVPEL